MPIHPPDRPQHETLREDYEMAILADRLGYKEGFFGEHITDQAENVTSSLIFIAWLLEQTKQIVLGTGTVNIPNHHPARVAAEVAMVDQMAKGRFLFGISPGGLMSDAEVFGNFERDRTAMFLEGIDLILKIWEKEAPYNLEGKFWKITTEQTMMPDIGQGTISKPYQTPHPPILVTAVAPFSKGVKAAAVRGWDPISANFLQPKWVASHWPNYVEGCEKGGRTARSDNWRVAKSIFIAEDRNIAEEYGVGSNGPYYFYFKSLFTKLLRGGRANLFKTDPNQSDDSLNVESIVDQLVIRGTVTEVVDQILMFRESIGEFGTLLYAGHDWMDQDLARKSMRLMAEEVMPRVNAAVK